MCSLLVTTFGCVTCSQKVGGPKHIHTNKDIETLSEDHTFFFLVSHIGDFA
jgi:hypothetical protein